MPRRGALPCRTWRGAVQARRETETAIGNDAKVHDAGASIRNALGMGFPKKVVPYSAFRRCGWISTAAKPVLSVALLGSSRSEQRAKPYRALVNVAGNVADVVGTRGRELRPARIGAQRKIMRIDGVGG